MLALSMAAVVIVTNTSRFHLFDPLNKQLEGKIFQERYFYLGIVNCFKIENSLYSKRYLKVGLIMENCFKYQEGMEDRTIG